MQLLLQQLRVFDYVIIDTPPMGFFGDPEEHIGRVCVQLAHPDFKYMTGETITLEGGMSLRP